MDYGAHFKGIICMALLGTAVVVAGLTAVDTFQNGMCTGSCCDLLVLKLACFGLWGTNCYRRHILQLHSV